MVVVMVMMYMGGRVDVNMCRRRVHDMRGW